jgi:hypothetical protein
MKTGFATAWMKAMPFVAVLLLPTDVLANTRSPAEQLLGDAQSKVRTEAVHSLVSRLQNEQHLPSAPALQSESSVIKQAKLETGERAVPSPNASPDHIQMTIPPAKGNTELSLPVSRPATPDRHQSTASRELPAPSSNVAAQSAERAENVNDKHVADTKLGSKTIQPEIPENSEAALIEAMIGNPARTEFMGYVRAGRVIRLAPSQTVVLSYVDSCLRETITGGTVTVGTDWSEVQSGHVVRLRGQCDTIRTLAATAQTQPRRTF